MRSHDATKSQSVARANTLQAFNQLNDYLRSAGFRGYEFDDYLSSRILNAFALDILFLQRVVVQMGKLNPINIRPLLGIKKLESTKARGFIARGHLALYEATGKEIYLMQAQEHLSWLQRNHSFGYRGISWGNAFDFASRGGFFPKGLPTVVWTAHIAETFERAYQITGAPEYRDVLRDAGTFILSELERHEDASGHCIAYAPGILNLVHNSNLLAAATVCRCWQHFPENVYKDAAAMAYAWSLSRQNSDGGWYYGAEPHYLWIDNFHTAYNIDCLLTGHSIMGERIVPWKAIERSYEYWVQHFFDGDGGPRYFHDQAYPYDIQSAAQAIETLYRCQEYFEGAHALANSVLDWTLRNMQKSSGAFRFQIRRFWTNRSRIASLGTSDNALCTGDSI